MQVAKHAGLTEILLSMLNMRPMSTNDIRSCVATTPLQMQPLQTCSRGCCSGASTSDRSPSTASTGWRHTIVNKHKGSDLLDVSPDAYHIGRWHPVEDRGLASDLDHKHGSREGSLPDMEMEWGWQCRRITWRRDYRGWRATISGRRRAVPWVCQVFLLDTPCLQIAVIAETIVLGWGCRPTCRRRDSQRGDAKWTRARLNRRTGRWVQTDESRPSEV